VNLRTRRRNGTNGLPLCPPSVSFPGINIVKTINVFFRRYSPVSPDCRIDCFLVMATWTRIPWIVIVNIITSISSSTSVDVCSASNCSELKAALCALALLFERYTLYWRHRFPTKINSQNPGNNIFYGTSILNRGNNIRGGLFPINNDRHFFYWASFYWKDNRVRGSWRRLSYAQVESLTAVLKEPGLSVSRPIAKQVTPPLPAWSTHVDVFVQ